MSLNTFITSESGAVTVDWVVLTAGLVGLGLATVAVASGGVENLSNDVAQSLSNVEVGEGYDWVSSASSLTSGWGDLGIFSPRQSATQAESYVHGVLNSNGGDYQAAYEQLYQQALDMTYADGESIDDLGAFEGMAAANGVTVNTGDNMSYAEMHAIYDANGSL